MAIYEHIFSEFKEGHLTPFYEKMYPELLTYANNLLGEEYAFLSEDCVQDSVFKAYEQLKSFSAPLQWKVFLYTCIRNEAISIFRKGKAQKNYLSQSSVHEEDLSTHFIEQETLTLLYEAIDALPEKFKILFELSFCQGLKNAEIAERLQLAEITIKKQKQQLIKLLRKNLEEKMDKEFLYLLLWALVP